MKIELFKDRLTYISIYFLLFIFSSCSTIPRDIPIEAITISEYKLDKPNNIDQKGNLINLQEFELIDFNISASRKYFYDYWERATPLSIPGGKLATTSEVHSMVFDNKSDNSAILIDVRSDKNELITAEGAVWLNGLGYAYRDIPNDAAINSRLNRDLNKITNKNKNHPIIFMCANPICALSYNSALRAINLGYKNVFWYRGGIEAWTIANLPLVKQKISEDLVLEFKSKENNN